MAYNIKYTIPFKSVKNQSFRIEILQDNYTGVITELTAGATPIVIDYNQEDFIYNPMRLAGATISLVGDSRLSDLYADNYQQYKVNLYNQSNDLLFTGFIMPEKFESSHSGGLSNIEIEVVSALATLDYTYFNNTAYSMTLLELIRDAIVKSGGDYRYVYVPHTYYYKLEYTTQVDYNILNLLSVSTQNFLDEQSEPMTYKEILEEICKVLHWTMTEKNGNIYFVDIDYIKKELNTYSRFDSTMNNHITTTLTNSKLIINDTLSRGYDNTYAKISSYNRVTVKDSDYEVDSLYPELQLEPSERIGAQFLTDKDITYEKRYFKPIDGFVTHRYRQVGSTFEPYDTSVQAWQLAGAIIQTSTDYETDYEKRSWTDMFQIKLFDGNINSNTILLDSFINQPLKFPVITTDVPTPSIAFDKDVRLCISFDIRYYDKDDGFPKREKTNKSDQLDGETFFQYFNVPIQLILHANNGFDYYWNGISWNPSNTGYINCFTDITKDTHFTYDWLRCRNTVKMTDNVADLNGTLVRFDRTQIGRLEMKIYCPHSVSQVSFDYNHRWVFMKNIKLEFQKIDKRVNRVKQDSFYTNVISNQYVSEMDDIEFKLTTKNESSLAYSKLVIDGEILDNHLYSVIHNKNVKQETYLIERIVNQYQQPKTKLTEMTTTNFTPYQLINMQSVPNKDFILTSENIDYAADYSTITMIEVI